MDVVVLPSPAGVGVSAVTNTKLLCLILSGFKSDKGNLALYFPYISISSSPMPNFSAIVLMCSNFAA